MPAHGLGVWLVLGGSSRWPSPYHNLTWGLGAYRRRHDGRPVLARAARGVGERPALRACWLGRRLLAPS